METVYRSLKVFISSPSDVAVEREITEKTIKEISETLKTTLGLILEPVAWENFVPSTPNIPEQKIQDVLNAKIPNCQIFILILWRRYGSISPGNTLSNTERETEIALNLVRNKKRIMFLTYFRDLPVNDDPGPQYESVRKFRERLQNQDVWFWRYKEPEEFREKLTHDLYQTVIKSRLSSRKHESLSNFWVFGTPDRPIFPNLAIIYPAMERSFMGPQNDPDVWINRLIPNMVFEDVKALQKLEKTLRLLGYSNFRIYNSQCLPPDLRYMNRFWICLRNRQGMQYFEPYKQQARFIMVPGKKKRADSYIRWKFDEASDEYRIIRSPLAKYILEQRSQMDISGDWKPEMQNIIAKDYAILARFTDQNNHMVVDDAYLKEYFLFGIRGLGTWGAAWFIDRQFPEFDQLDPQADFQFLLEVEYRDGRIYDVKNVSHQPKSYFDREYKIETIRKNIESYNPMFRC